LSRKVTELKAEEVFLQRRKLERTFIRDTISCYKTKVMQIDCMCNSLIFQGVQCAKCPLVFKNIGCYLRISWYIK
jgi:hypothetical protein